MEVYGEGQQSSPTKNKQKYMVVRKVYTARAYVYAYISWSRQANLHAGITDQHNNA